MTLKEELGFLYRDMVAQKMWFDRLAEKETDSEKKKYYKGEAYTAVTIANRVERMVTGHFKDGQKEVREWLKQAKEQFEEGMK